LVKQLENWPWSTYCKFVKEGLYGPAGDFKEVTNLDAEQCGE
jgi:hypothetical protein